MEAAVTCGRCGGDGAEPGTSPATCPTCAGAGRVQQVSRSVFGEFVRTAPARTAAVPAGSSRRPARSAAAQGRTLEDAGPRRRDPGRDPRRPADPHPRRGHAGALGGAAGRRLRRSSASRRHERFVREGNDIFSTVDLTIIAGGARRAAVTCRRSTAMSSSSSSRARSPARSAVLRGKGMPVLQGFGRGDHRVLVNVLVPRRLTDEQRRLLEEFEQRLDEETYRRDEGFFDSSEARFAERAVILRRVVGGRSRRAGGAGARGDARALSRGLRGAGRRRLLELAAYTNAAGEERIWQAFGGAASAPTSTTTGRSAGAQFHRPRRVGSLWIGPPWEPPDEDAIAVVIDPGPRVRHRRPPTTRLCLELLEAAGARQRARRRLRLGRALDRGRQARVRAGRRGRPRPARRSRRRERNAAANGVDVDVRLGDARDDELPAADVAVANIAGDAGRRARAEAARAACDHLGLPRQRRPALDGYRLERRVAGRRLGGRLDAEAERGTERGATAARAPNGLSTAGDDRQRSAALASVRRRRSQR